MAREHLQPERVQARSEFFPLPPDANRWRKSLGEGPQKCSQGIGVGFEGNQSNGVDLHLAGLTLAMNAKMCIGRTARCGCSSITTCKHLVVD